MPTNKISVSIAFSNLCTAQWMAGCNYLKNLFIALKSSENCPEIVLFSPAASDDTVKSILPYVDRHLIFSAHRPISKRIRFLAQRKLRYNLGASAPIADFLRERQVDVLFSMNRQGTWFDLPLLAWITDF